MASKSTTATALFFALNLLFFSLVSVWSWDECPMPESACPILPPNVPKETCPIDILKFAVCGKSQGDLPGSITEIPPPKLCCTLIGGLAHHDAAVCLCVAIKANILGINLNIPVSLGLILSACEKKVPEGFKCA